MRDSFWGRGKVLIVQNTSGNTVNLWLFAHGKTYRFALQPYGRREVGWIEGYEFGDNSTILIGGEDYAPQTFTWSD
jgi:hypothetical protein